jgi:hypothetical protein
MTVFATVIPYFPVAPPGRTLPSSLTSTVNHLAGRVHS